MGIWEQEEVDYVDLPCQEACGQETCFILRYPVWIKTDHEACAEDRGKHCDEHDK